METYMLTLIYWWILVSTFAVILIMLRDDAAFFFKDLKDSFKDGLFYGIVFFLAYFFYSPITLPYSINYFLEKCKKN
jgi:hypothetical protein